MPRIGLIAFDLLDTVVIDPFYTEIPKLFDLPIEEVVKILSSETWIAFETGRIDEATYLRRVFREQARSPSYPPSQKIKETILSNYHFVPGMEDLLSDLSCRSAAVWALSNYPLWFNILRRELNLDRFFENFVMSFQTGYRKPSSQAYLALCRLSGVDQAHCLLIDDRESNVAGARQLGMSAIRFQSVGQTRKELSALGLL